MTEPRPTLAGHGEVLYWYCSKMDVAYAADESFCEDQWCIPQDVGRKSYYRISQRPRSPSSFSELLQPSVALASPVDTSYRKIIGPGNPLDPVSKV